MSYDMRSIDCASIFIHNSALICFSPIKADFIRAKYQFLAFTKKYKDEEIGTVTDLSKVGKGQFSYPTQLQNTLWFFSFMGIPYFNIWRIKMCMNEINV